MAVPGVEDQVVEAEALAASVASVVSEEDVLVAGVREEVFK